MARQKASQSRVPEVARAILGTPDTLNASLAKALEAWFRATHRRLPWRGVPGQPRDPYVVLVSELMLQQTQVARVEEKFGAFIDAFPTIGALARASEDEVLALWSGLGYYRRARLLHAAAKAVVATHAGVLPGSAAGLKELPGVGPYTAGAIASLAFGEASALVDGNVARVLIRIDGQDLSAGADGLAWAWTRAETLILDAVATGVHPGVLNESLMELGAVVCRPAGPRCSECPVRESCTAHAIGRQDELPRPKARAKRARVRLDALVLSRADGAVLMEKQGDDALWAGLWQPPTTPTPTAAGTGRALGLRLKRLAASMGATPSRAGIVRRTLTHREVEFVVWEARVREVSNALDAHEDPTRLKWILPAGLRQVGISSACLALLEAATKAARA
jgi:A/G-specific adenine glycosylase